MRLGSARPPPVPPAPLLALAFVLALALALALPSRAEMAFNACRTDAARTEALVHQTGVMFDHALGAYLAHAFPRDELRPLSCRGDDTFGGLSLTLIDSLDTLVLFRRWPRFVWATRHLRAHLSFDRNETVSVFETTIRALGGLLSAHALLVGEVDGTGFDARWWYASYDDALLWRAVDLADRLMPAFDTPTGIPFGAVHLQNGVQSDESRVASTAGAGSLLLEFGTLSRLTRDPRYYRAAFRAMHALHARAAWTGLVGNHINIDDGTWVATDSGVGGLVDSFYEYMAKGYILFGDARLLRMFHASSAAVQSFVRRAPWFLDADMWSGQTSNVFHSSLSAFYPGLQTLMGRVRPAAETTRAHFSVWRKYGCLPEGYNVVSTLPMVGQVNYPLRPELAESLFYLHWATEDPMWVGAAATMLHSIESLARTRCGYAEIADVRDHRLGDIMPSFLISETLKYLLLTFQPTGPDGATHWMRRGDVVLTTEAHPLRVARIGEMDAIFGSDAATGQRIPDDEDDGERGEIIAEDGGADDEEDAPGAVFGGGGGSGADHRSGTTGDGSGDGQQRRNADGKRRRGRRRRVGEAAGRAAHRLKCRLPAATDGLPCGYAMGGSDFPAVLDVDQMPSEAVAADVVKRVERLMRDNGVHWLRVGGPGTARREFRLVAGGRRARCARRRVGQLVVRSVCARVAFVSHVELASVG